jgi:hypothetical protein
LETVKDYTFPAFVWYAIFGNEPIPVKFRSVNELVGFVVGGNEEPCIPAQAS